ncbi:hypothetical protein [Actinomadura litoris]|uniref:hypothetical protein n=1 Tax=Actinomadura litoris TaxID=2678616 RepID=UPI002342BD94|nr:hypothetical protein [Actinomadura litoris]
MARLGRGQPNRPIVSRGPTGPLGGLGTITVTFTASGSGIAHAAGTGTIAVDFAPAGTGVKHAPGAGDVTVTFTPTGTGTRQTGIGLPPRPRTRWQLVVGPAAGGHELALTAATARRYTAKLNEPSEMAFTIDAEHPQAAEVRGLLKDVHLLFTDSSGTTTILDRGRVAQRTHTFGESSIFAAITCLDYRAILARRFLWSDATLTYTAMDPAEIAWSLISYTQGKTNGTLGISKGWSGTSPTGVVLDERTFEVGDAIGQRIQELSERVDGFDWDITPTSASGLRMDVWAPDRGVDRGVVLQRGGLMATATREEAATDYANAIRYTGVSGLDPVELEAPDLPGAEQGRWEAGFGDDGLTAQEMLDDRAAWQLGQSQVLTPVWTVTLRRGAWDGPSHIWLGDPVRVIANAQGIATDVTLRVHEIDIGLDGQGGESVQLTLGGPRPSYQRRATAIERRLAALERR